MGRGMRLEERLDAKMEVLGVQKVIGYLLGDRLT